MANKGITNTDSATIGRLRLPLAVGVVFIHLNMGVSGRHIGWETFGCMDIYRLFVCIWTNELAALAVPLFFMISGYLFFGGGTTDYKTKLWRRVRSLLLPYIIFNLLAVFGLIANKVMQGHSFADSINSYLGGMKWLHNLWDIHVTGTSTNILGISKPTAYPINIPLWFMRDLMMLAVLSPLIYHAIRYLKWGWLLLMGALTLTGIWIPLPGFGVTSCLFFSMGAWFGINRLSIAHTLDKWRWLLLAISLPLMFGDIIADGTSIDKYLHIAFLIVGILTVYTFAQSIKTKAPKWSGQASFFIFAAHTLPLVFLSTRPIEWCKGLLWTNSPNGFICILQFLAAGLLTALLCLLAFLLLQKICPSFVNFITGRKAKHL